MELLGVVRDIEERGVVLINENNDSLACLLISRPDEGHESRARGPCVGASAPKGLLFRQRVIEQLFKLPLILGFHGGKVDANDRVGFPGSFKLRDGESVEELTPAFEICLHGGEQKRLAEAAGAAEEIGRAGAVCKLVHKGRLVDVEVTALADFFKRLDPDGIPA